MFDDHSVPSISVVKITFFMICVGINDVEQDMNDITVASVQVFDEK